MRGRKRIYIVAIVLCACPVAGIGASRYSSFEDTIPDVILAGQSGVHHLFGGFVACGGDVNNDGYDDFAVTASRFNDCSGRAYLYFGGRNRVYKHADHIFDGEAPGDIFGEYIILADLNNDKYADVVVGAVGYKNWQGRVYVYFGGPDMDERADIVFDGEAGTYGWFGRVIDAADIDNDGYTDLVINAVCINERRGRAYLYYGGRPMDTVADKIFDGENPGDLFGREMDMGADVNGDGYGELIFGCRAWNGGRRGEAGRGRAYLYYGGPKEIMDTQYDRVFTGESIGDELGASVCLFDIDNDKYAEVMIGARSHRQHQYNQGRMYLYWGGTNTGIKPDLVFDGEVVAGRRWGVRFGGDNIDCGYLNDDAYADILVGAMAGGQNGQGRVYLYYGAPKGSMDVICDNTFTGEGGMFGWNTALGDINGDHLADLVISACFYPGKRGVRIGRAYVYYTKPFPSASAQMQPQFVQEGYSDMKPPGSLHRAAARGDIDQVKSLISAGSNINALDRDDMVTPLHRAVIAGQKDVVEVLLNHGARIDALDNMAFTPLHRAAEYGHTDIAMLLINRGADINRRDSLSISALHHASEKGHRDVAALLIAKGADVNAKDAYGYKPLHCAAEAGHKDIVKLLITKGADVNAKNNAGQTPLDIAIGQNRKEIVDLLIEKGASMSSTIHAAAYTGDLDKVKKFLEAGTAVDAKDAESNTALHFAIINGHKDIVELLLAKGADINAISEDGDTPLHSAVRRGHKDIVELLIAKGVDVNAKDQDGSIPLVMAVSGGHTDLVKFLIDKGANVNAKNASGDRSLHYAAKSRSAGKDVIELLIAKGADVNVKNNDGQTPMDLAISRNRKEIVQLLLAKGATISSIHVAAQIGDLARVKAFLEEGTDVNAKDGRGYTPFHYAIWYSKTDIARLLIEKGADIHVKDRSGYTPLHWAVIMGNRELTELLLSKGADVNVKGKAGETPLDFAVFSEGIGQLLVDKGAEVSSLQSAALIGDLDKVKTFISEGADVNKSYFAEVTALHVAAGGGHKDIVEFLIVKGANINTSARGGQTPLHWAADKGHRDIVELLIAKGADVNAKGRRGRTPLDIAVKRGHTEIAELLRKHGAKE